MSKLSRIFCCIFCMAILACTATGAITVSAASKNTVTTSISKVEAKGKAFKVTWKKKSKIKGYQIQYSTSSKFKKSETQTKTVSKAKTTSATISKLKGCNKTYYVRVRTYKVVNDKKVYSSWSKAKSVTTLKHKYSAATCTKAKICKYCNKTSGEKLGHKYAAATCTKAKTCTRCKATSGKALGHKYAAATCTKAKTCTRCKATSGKTLGHKYSAATCTKAKTCTRCKATSGKALGHKWNKYVCTVCKTIDKTHAYEYLIEWVKTNGVADGSYVCFEYLVDDDTKYSLNYSATKDYLYVSKSGFYQDVFYFYELGLDDYSCYGYFDDVEALGYINANEFTRNSPIIEIDYAGPSDYRWSMLELTRLEMIDLISWLDWCLESYEVGVDICDLGFESFV